MKDSSEYRVKSKELFSASIDDGEKDNSVFRTPKSELNNNSVLKTRSSLFLFYRELALAAFRDLLGDLRGYDVIADKLHLVASA